MSTSIGEMRGLFFSKMREKTSLHIKEVPSPNCNARADAYDEQGVFIKEEQSRKPIATGIPDTLILHYTACNLSDTLKIFQTPDKSSAHYTIDISGDIYFHVKEDKRAWHAGVSWWQGRRDNNSYSIGIEHVNFGYKHQPYHPNAGIEVTGSPEKWYPFPEVQMQTSIALCKDIVKHYAIYPWKVLGHSDVAPGRKVDPGPLFPWEQLAKTGIGMWWDQDASKANSKLYGQVEGISVPWMQENLAAWGYGYDGQPLTLSGKEDEPTTAVVKSFQMHFRQNNINGKVDRESMEILDSLLRTKIAIETEDASKVNRCTF